jgi:hypothetical protein
MTAFEITVEDVITTIKFTNNCKARCLDQLHNVWYNKLLVAQDTLATKIFNRSEATT